MIIPSLSSKRLITDNLFSCTGAEDSVRSQLGYRGPPDGAALQPGLHHPEVAPGRKGTLRLKLAGKTQGDQKAEGQGKIIRKILTPN